MPHLLVLRGPSGAGKSTLAEALRGEPSEQFVVLKSNELPSPEGFPNPANSIAEAIAKRTGQISFWGRLVREGFVSGRNVLLDCDLQDEHEATALAQAVGLPIPGRDTLVIRLEVSVETAILRYLNRAPAETAHWHETWGATHLVFEEGLNTEGLTPNGVRALVLELIREKWYSGS